MHRFIAHEEHAPEHHYPAGLFEVLGADTVLQGDRYGLAAVNYNAGRVMCWQFEGDGWTWTRWTWDDYFQTWDYMDTHDSIGEDPAPILHALTKWEEGNR